MNIRLLLAEFTTVGFYILFLGIMNTVPSWMEYKSIINIIVTFIVLALMALMIYKT